MIYTQLFDAKCQHVHVVLIYFWLLNSLTAHRGGIMECSGALSLEDCCGVLGYVLIQLV